MFLLPVFFLKFVFSLPESRVSVVLGWYTCLSLLRFVMKFWILFIVLLASFDDFNIFNNWAVLWVECDSLRFQSSPTVLYNWIITLFWTWFLKHNVDGGWEKKFRVFTGPCCNLIGQWLATKEFLFIYSFWRKTFCIFLAGDVHSNVTMDRHLQFASPTHLRSGVIFWWSQHVQFAFVYSFETLWSVDLNICLLTWDILMS